MNRKIEGLEGAAVRINAMANTNKVSERDYAKYRRAGFAPSLAFGMGTDTRFNISHLYQAEDNTPDYGVPFYAGKPADVDRSNFYGFKSNDHLKTDTNITTAKFEHDFNKDLTFRNQSRYARYYRDVQVVEPQANTAGTSVVRTGGSNSSCKNSLRIIYLPWQPSRHHCKIFHFRH
jgi:catecholate siderophore receptor